MPVKAENRARYPKDWPQIAEGVKAAAGWCCKQCGVAHGEVVEPGPGGAHHHYTLGHGGRGVTHLNFQNGGVSEVGPNGTTEAQLIAVLIHRLEAFQSGPFRSRENAITITKLEEALMWQQQRTMNRMRKGIEGRSVVEGPAQPDPDALKGVAGPSA